MSNTASFVIYGTACLIRLVELAAFFATFEESVCYTSGVRQAVPPEYTVLAQPIHEARIRPAENPGLEKFEEFRRGRG